MIKNILKNKYCLITIIAVVVCACTVAVTLYIGSDDNTTADVLSSDAAVLDNVTSDLSSLISSEVLSEGESSLISSTSSKKASSSNSSKKTSSKVQNSSTVQNTVVKGDYQYNSNLNIEDNVFMDSLIYTGYNMKEHRADGLMWTYVLAKYKRGYGWLSNITYAGGSSGLETKNGKPDIKAFEGGGFVCASFATYVYFNYLPNVAGIDTSSLPRPTNTRLADSWYKAVQQWIKKGYSRSIDFTATVDPSTRYIKFKPKEEIPIGSIIIFRTYESRNSKNKVGSHVVVYAGYKNGNHWVYHVGTKNGPEMCAVERMLYGPEAQWPMLVVTTPSNIRMAAMLEVELKDDDSKPISGVSFSLKSKETGKTITLGKTDKNGKLTKECLNYGEYTLIQTSTPNGYTVSNKNTTIKLTTKNNSKNTVKVVNSKIKVVESSATEQSNSNVSSEG